MGGRLVYRLLAWAVVATLGAFAIDLGLNQLGWANTPGAEVEALFTVSLMAFLFILAKRQVIKPLRAVERMAGKIRSGDLTARVDERSSAEMSMLSDTLNSMAEKLADSYEQLRAYNVTLEKTVEERTKALALERNKLSAIFRGIPDGVVFVSVGGMIVDANPMMDRSVQTGFSGFTGHSVSELPDGPVKDALARGLDGCGAEGIEATVGGRTYKVGCSSLPGGPGEVSGSVVTFYDVTEEKLLEKRKADFVSLLTHDLKSPLTSILGYSELMLEDESYALGEREREFVKSMEESGRRLLEMIEQYLDLARIEAGMLKMNISPARPADIIGDAMCGLDVQAVKKGVSLSVDIARDLPEVEVDREKMARVVMNLVSNAIKYTPKGGGVKVSARKAGGGLDAPRLEIAVRDNGQGIPAEDLPHIFDRYYRSDRSSAIKGTGLGLAVVKSLVEMHKGEVDVLSVPGEGSVFVVRIPIAR